MTAAGFVPRLRRLRVREIGAGRTWIVLDGDSRPAATLTASPNHHGIWADQSGHEPAVYVRRTVVSAATAPG